LTDSELMVVTRPIRGGNFHEAPVPLTGGEMSIVVSTDALPVGDRPAFWHDVVCQTFVPLRVAMADNAEFSGSVTTDQLGPVQISTVRAKAQQVMRTPSLIAASAHDYMLVGLETKGPAVVAQDGREALLRPGDLAFYDTTRPYLLGFRQSFQMQVFLLPRRAFGLSESVLNRITGVTVRGDEGLGALVAPFLSRLATQAGTYGETGGERLGATAVDLLTAVIAQQLGPADTAETAAGARALLARIRAFIAAHLADPDLSPESVARAHHISPRYLHRLFEAEDTTISRYIQHRRLEQCRRELSRRSGANAPTIAAIAHRWGFTDPAHFSRVFRAHYGQSPRALRSTPTQILPD
jgi:AraC-like DNA-binding protein